MADGLKVRFWGVRGSISCSGTEYARYGGNTSCLEITAGGRRLIFDAGTGIRTLGLQLARQGGIDIDIYFTHTHLDHISGLTFFAPLFDQAKREADQQHMLDAAERGGEVLAFKPAGDAPTDEIPEGEVEPVSASDAGPQAAEF